MAYNKRPKGHKVQHGRHDRIGRAGETLQKVMVKQLILENSHSNHFSPVHELFSLKEIHSKAIFVGNCS